MVVATRGVPNRQAAVVAGVDFARSDPTAPDNQPTVSIGPGEASGFPRSDGTVCERSGDRIGPYKLLEVIGEGGFGAVWLAERREPMVQRVAFKIIEPGMDSRAAIAAGREEALRRARADERAVAAEKAETAEKERADQLKQVADFQASMLSGIDANAAGTSLMRDVRERFAASLAKAGLTDASRQAEIVTFEDLLVRVDATDVAAAMIDRTILQPAVQAIDERFKDQPVVDAGLRQALADLHHAIGLHDAALSLQETARATRRRVLGEEHPDTLRSIDRLAIVLRSKGRMAEAATMHQDLANQCRRVLGAEHPAARWRRSTTPR